MMVGRELEEETQAEEDRASTTTHGRPALRVRGLTAPGIFADVDLDVGAGEIVGLAGLVGAGRSELLETIFGLRSPSAGTIEVDGDGRTLRSPRHAIRNRIGFVPADRKTQGLVLAMSVRENLVMATTSRVPRLAYPRPTREARSSNDAIGLAADQSPLAGGVRSRRSRAGTSRRSCSASGSRASRAC